MTAQVGHREIQLVHSAVKLANVTRGKKKSKKQVLTSTAYRIFSILKYKQTNKQISRKNGTYWMSLHKKKSRVCVNSLDGKMPMYSY